VALPSVWLQPITYRGRLLACATAARVFLSAELQRRPAGDAELRFVLLMCCYARDVITGQLPGPYRCEDARRYAQAALIPDELLERDTQAEYLNAMRIIAYPHDAARAA